MNASLKDMENQLRNFWTQPQPEVGIEQDKEAYEAFKTQLGGNHTMTTLTEKQQAFMELVAVHQLAGAVQEQAEEGMREILLSIAKEALEGTSQPEQKLYPINAAKAIPYIQ